MKGVLMNGQTLSRAELWKQRLRDAGKPLVMLETTRAIWYICGIEQQDSAKLTVSYLAPTGKERKMTLKREKVNRADIIKMRPYVNA